RQLDSQPAVDVLDEARAVESLPRRLAAPGVADAGVAVREPRRSRTQAAAVGTSNAGPAPQRPQCVRPGLAVHKQPMVALEPAHGPPRAAVVEPVRPDVEQPLDAPHRRSVLAKPQDSV